MVAVETPESVAIASGVRDIWESNSGADGLAAHLAGRAHRVKGCRQCLCDGMNRNQA
jgi:hypothetical protein